MNRSTSAADATSASASVAHPLGGDCAISVWSSIKRAKNRHRLDLPFPCSYSK